MINNTERHPLSFVYGNWILNSDTGKALSDGTLTSSSIRKLRKEATVKCDNHDGNRETKICNPLEKPCLFNLLEDPCEMNNLANVESEKLLELSKLIDKYSADSVWPRNQPADSRCNPGDFNDTWTWWWDELGIE